MTLEERLSDVAGIATWLVVGVPIVVDAALDPGPYLDAGGALFALGYLGFGAVFLGLVRGRLPRVLQRPRWLPLAALAAAAAAAVIALPEYNFTAILMIITASVASHLLPLRRGLLLVLGQSAVLLAAWLPVIDNAFGVVVMVVAYSTFQIFALLTTKAMVDAAEARTRLTHANAELRATQALLADSSRLAERGRIARELHDLIGHHLTALSLNLEVAAHQAEGPALEQVEKSRAIAKLLLADVRSVVSSMREDAHIDLHSALHELVADIPRPAVHLELEPDLDIDAPGTAQVVVRCVQEITTNAIKHSGADNLWIAVARDAHGIALAARDDGRGAERLDPGNGLTGMRERLEQVGGRLDVETRPGGGFRLAATLPA